MSATAGRALFAAGAAWARRAAPPVTGFRSGVSRAESEDRLAAFRRGLAEAGYEEGRNLAIECRFADGDYDRLAAMAAGLQRRPVGVLVAAVGTRAPMVARAGDLPLLLPDPFELVLNPRAAAALGLAVPAGLRSSASGILW